MKKTSRAPGHLSKEAKKFWKSLISEYAIEDVAGLKILRVALEAFDRAMEVNPAFVKAMLGKGTVLRELKRYDEALACYDAAITVEGPEVVAAFYDKATLLNQLGRREEAVAHYNMVNQLEPEFAEAWHEKAHILEELGWKEEAEECLKEHKLISSQSGGCCAS